MPKKVIALMGSPRKNGNTATLVREALRGAQEAGAETRLVCVEDLKMKGCQGCYSCKMKQEVARRCIQNDDMSPLYQEIEEADAIVFGSPVYMGTMTAQLKLLVDRLFPYIPGNYQNPLLQGKKCGLIFTQNQIDPDLFQNHFSMTSILLKFMGFDEPEILVSVDTIGYEGKQEKLAVPESEKRIKRKSQHREREFPADMRKAYEMGKRMGEEKFLVE